MPPTSPSRTWDPQLLIDATGQPLRAIARRLGIDPANLCRPLTDIQADRYATALGYHPVAIWGTSWWE